MGVAAALPIAGMALSAFGTVQQGLSEKQAAYRQAQQDEENGRLTVKAGEEDVWNVLREGAKATDEAAAVQASSGLAWGGSIATVLSASAEQVDMDIDRVRLRARNEANNYYAQARERRKSGRQALLGSVFSALASTVGGVADIRRQQRLDKQAQTERAAKAGG